VCVVYKITAAAVIPPPVLVSTSQRSAALE